MVASATEHRERGLDFDEQDDLDQVQAAFSGLREVLNDPKAMQPAQLEAKVGEYSKQIIEVANDGGINAYHAICDEISDLRESLTELAHIRAQKKHGQGTFGEYLEASIVASTIDTQLDKALETVAAARHEQRFSYAGDPDGAEARESRANEHSATLTAQLTDAVEHSDIQAMFDRAGDIKSTLELTYYLKEIHANDDGHYGNREQTDAIAEHVARLYTEHLSREAISYIDDVANPDIADDLKNIIFAVSNAAAYDLSNQAAAQQYTERHLIDTGAHPGYAADQAAFQHPASLQELEDTIAAAKQMSNANPR